MSCPSCQCTDVVEKTIAIDHYRFVKNEFVECPRIICTGIYVCAECGAFSFDSEDSGDLSKNRLSVGKCQCSSVHSKFIQVMSKEAHQEWMCLINDPAALLIENSYHRLPKWAQENVQAKQPTQEQIDKWLSKHSLEDLYATVIKARKECNCSGDK